MSISWIDRAGLAETLARFGTTASGPAHIPRAPTPTPQPRRTPPAPTSVTHFEPITSSLSERLEEFLDWLASVSGSRVSFIVDRDGLPLIDRGADADVLAMASSFIQLAERINRQMLAAVGQTMTVQLEHGQLMLTSVKTPIGLYTVGQVDRRSPDPTARVGIEEGLRAVFRSAEESSSRQSLGPID